MRRSVYTRHGFTSSKPRRPTMSDLLTSIKTLAENLAGPTSSNHEGGER